MPKQTCACGAKYRFDESAVGKKARCKKCGRVFTIKPDADEGMIPLAGDDPFAAEAAAAAAERAQTAPASPPYGVGRASSAPSWPESIPADRPSPPLVDEPKPSKGYWSSLAWTFLFLTSLNNLVTFFIMWALLCLSGLLLGAAFWLGAIGQFVILGWYCALRFETVIQAAAGEDDLPSLAFSDGWLDDIVVPFFKWIGSWAVVFIPAVVCLIVMMAIGSAAAGDLLPMVPGGVGAMVQALWATMLFFVVLMLFGLFMWPMIALCVGLGGFQTLARLDLILVTIVRTLPIYVLTVAIVFGASFVSGLVAAASDASTIASILVIGAGLYCELVAMRAIGLYYHHFKHRFAWDWG